MMQTPFTIALIYVAVLAASAMLPSAADSEPRVHEDRPSVAANRQPVTIQYFRSQPVDGYDGHENKYIGEFRVCVKIFEVHGLKYLFFWNVMTASDRWLVINPVLLKKNTSGKLEFKFVDNWANEGTGSIEYLNANRVRVDITSTKPSEEPSSRNILGQYGTNVLPRAACPHERFLEGVTP